MRRVSFPGLGALAIGLACRAPTSDPPVTDSEYPFVRISVYNNWADEGEEFEYRIRSDRTFEAVFEGDEGGGSTYRTTCTGTLDPSLVEPWLPRVRSSPAVGPDTRLVSSAVYEGMPNYDYSVDYFVSPTNIHMADATAWRDDFEVWLEGLLGAPKTCETKPATPGP